MNTKQGDLENIILNALWNLEENGHENIDVADIQKKINTDNQKWAYTTVKTVLDRLVEKNIVTRFKFSKKYFYKSMVSRLAMGEKAIRRLARQYFNNDIEELLKSTERLHCESLVLVR